MGITDELREWWLHKFPVMDKELHQDFMAIADRIDAEHESACAEAYGNGVQSVALPDMTAYIKLPLDANGETVRIGDTMDGYGKTVEIVELRYGRSGWVLISRDGNGYADTFAFTHHHEPTVEDVLREFAQCWDDPVHYAKGELVEQYAARLRLAGDGKE